MDILLNRRRLMMATAGDWYVTDGLVLHFDGINKGSNPNRWSAIVSSHYFNLNSNITTVESNAIVTNGSGQITGSTGVLVPAGTGTIEFCGQLITNVTTGFFFAGNNGQSSLPLSLVKYKTGLMFSYARRNPNIYPFANLETVIASPFSVSMSAARGMLNGVAATASGSNGFNNTHFSIGGKSSSSYLVNARYHSIRLYNRQLTEEEILQNLRIDNERFSLGLNLPQ